MRLFSQEPTQTNLNNLIYTTDTTTPKLLPRHGSQRVQIRLRQQASQTSKTPIQGVERWGYPLQGRWSKKLMSKNLIFINQRRKIWLLSAFVKWTILLKTQIVIYSSIVSFIQKELSKKKGQSYPQNKLCEFSPRDGVENTLVRLPHTEFQ